MPMIVVVVVVVVMVVVMVVIMHVIVGFPVAVLLSIGHLVCPVVETRAPQRLGLFKVFRPMGVIVRLADHPAIQQGVTLVHTGRRTQLVFNRGGPGIVVKVVKQLRIHSAQRDAAQFAGKGAVVDVSGTPEVTAGRYLAKLHHPRGAPQVIGLLRAIMVGNIVLVKRGRHAVEKRHGMRDRVVVEQLDQAARGD